MGDVRHRARVLVYFIGIEIPDFRHAGFRRIGGFDRRIWIPVEKGRKAQAGVNRLIILRLRDIAVERFKNIKADIANGFVPA